MFLVTLNFSLAPPSHQNVHLYKINIKINIKILKSTTLCSNLSGFLTQMYFFLTYPCDFGDIAKLSYPVQFEMITEDGSGFWLTTRDHSH